MLKVTGKDGQAIFCRRATVSNQHDPEERLTAMLYRHQVEFAVGHGGGVHVEVADVESADAYDSTASPALATRLPPGDLPRKRRDPDLRGASHRTAHRQER